MPPFLEDETALDEVLTRPGAALVDFIRTVASPLVIVGAGGKMGPTLAVLARRAAEAAGHPLRVIAVSRFSDAAVRAWLETQGVQTLAADLLERAAVRALPDTPNVISLVGVKFGTESNPALTWAVNTLVPERVAERYADARCVALSTGNVYPLVPVVGGGATEDHPLAPVGEYAQAALARERIFEYLSRKHRTPLTLVRLNYAVELRYGVLLDLARRVHTGAAIDLTTGHFNCIWQGDANASILRSLALAEVPPRPLNLTGPECLSVRAVATRLAEHLGRPARFTGVEAPTALLSNAGRMRQLLGTPPTPLEVVLRWTAHWVEKGGRTFGKPTYFEVRDGRY